MIHRHQQKIVNLNAGKGANTDVSTAPVSTILMAHKQVLLTFLLIAIIFCLPNCSGKQIVSVHTQINTNIHKHFYIIERTTSTVIGFNVMPIPGSVVVTDGAQYEREAIGQTAVHIRNTLARKGFQATIGDGKIIPKETDIVVTYHDAWQWDFKMYLKSLVITFYDPITKQKLAEGTYKASISRMHDFPDSEREVPNIIDGILAEKK